MQFTNLERDILKWFATKNQEMACAQQCGAAICKHREYTGSGYFVVIDVPKDYPPCSSPLVEPHIESDELELGAGAILFAKDGYLDLLEIYSYSATFPETLNKYRLTDRPPSSY